MLHEQDSTKRAYCLLHDVKPYNYVLTIFDIEFGGEWTYGGLVSIEAEALTSVDHVVVNADQLDITAAKVSCGDATSSVKSITTSQDNQYICLNFHDTIPKGRLQLEISFKGRISQSMCGFFRARYESSPGSTADLVKVEKHHYQLATDFEPCDARKAFPCFDEPHLKATFELELEVPLELTALSNMPEKTVRVLAGAKTGLKTVRFETTPMMSTYLLCWSVGDFEYVEALTKREHVGKRVPVRVYATKGLTQFANFALRDACDTLDFFAERFGVDYPLPKCDHLVVHEFISGAMENWGLITYKPTKILFDPSNSDNRLMSKASYVLAHELAHQWFGNLVTMSGWNELWLNEGFATWAGYLAVDYLHPEWNIWAQYVGEALEEAFSLDSLSSSHPIESCIEVGGHVHQMFDSITYSKGSAVIRMLVNYLGQATFFDGIARYLKDRAYQNATSSDLWQALSDASGLDVAAMMDAWIHQAGFPTVSATLIQDELHVGQQAFPGLAAPTRQTHWHIPLGTGDASSSCTTGIFSQESTIVRPFAVTSILNKDHVGFYRIAYFAGNGTSLHPLSSSLSSSDKVGMMTDMASLVFIGSKSVGELLSLLTSFRRDRDGHVWSQIRKSASIVLSSITNDARAVQGFKAFLRQLLSEVKAEITWTGSPNSYIRGELEKNLIQLAATADDQDIIAEVKSSFALWKTGDKKAISRNLHTPILGIAIAKGSDEEYQAVQAAYIEDRTIDRREIYIAAMGKTSSKAMTWDFLDFTFASDDNVTLQNIHFVGIALSNGPCAAVLWEYVKDNWDKVYNRLQVNSVALDWFIENSLSGFDDLDTERDIARFFAEKKLEVVEHSVSIVRDSIRRNAAQKECVGRQIPQWLEENGYFR